MLKKQIRKSLLETKDKKDKSLIEENLIKTRFSFLLEGINTKEDFNNLSEKKQLKLSIGFIQELSFLSSVGLMNEQEQDNWGGLLNKMFGKSFGSIAQTMVEPFLRNILSGIGIEEGYVRNFIISYLTSRPSDVVDSFGDCKKMTKLISEAMVESMVMTTQRKKGYSGFGYDLIRNELGRTLKNTELISGIERGLEEKVCSSMSKLVDNTKSVVDKLKNVTNNGY